MFDHWLTFLRQIFPKKCFCSKNISKIVRPVLATVSINGLTYTVSRCGVGYSETILTSLFPLCAEPVSSHEQDGHIEEEAEEEVKD